MRFLLRIFIFDETGVLALKFGVVVHEKTRNLGDDIQSYACLRQVPEADYVLDREHLDMFQSENNEPVAAIFSAWWLWYKWNWPPAECIYPLLVGMHFNNYGMDDNGSPIENEWLEGIGKDFLTAYGPVGVRDESSIEFLNDLGIDNYFSGCITLTLPKQKETDDKGTYIVINDLNPACEKATRKWAEDNGLEVRVLTHQLGTGNAELSFEERMKLAEERLIVYQNAVCVVTRRLHCTLPCIAMGVPVVPVVGMDTYKNTTRWYPYYHWVNPLLKKDVAKGNFPYDPFHVPAPKQEILDLREELLRRTAAFVEEVRDIEATAEDVRKTTYTAEEARQWQFTLLRDTQEKWIQESRRMNNTIEKNKQEINKLKKENERLKAEQKESLYLRLRHWAGRIWRKWFKTEPPRIGKSK